MKRTLSLILSLLMLLSALPVTALAAEADSAETGGEAFSVSTAAELRAALQYEGNAVISVAADISYTIPVGFEWDQYYSYRFWTILGAGDKTLNLNGHRVYITDNLVTTAKYVTEKRYNVETGKTEEVYTLLENSFVKTAFMFGVFGDASLTINGAAAGSAMMMDAQMPAYEQMMTNEIVMFREVFYVNGGRLTLNGGEYQAGRRKSLYANRALKAGQDWRYEINWFDESIYHYIGYGEYAIHGSTVRAVGRADVDINGGTLIAHGMGARDSRSACIRCDGAGTSVTVNDAILHGYTGADAIRTDDKAILTVMAGEMICDAPERMLWPAGKPHEENTYSHVYTTDSYYDAIDVGAGNTVIEPTFSYTSVTTSGNKTTYAPTSRGVDALKWYDGSRSALTYYLGAGQKALFDMPYIYFPGEEIPGVLHDYRYEWGLAEKNEKGSYVSVPVDGSAWTSTGHSRLFDLSTVASYLKSGGSYRMTARLNEDWSSTHSYNYKVTASSSLYFVARDYVVDALDIYVNAPTAGQKLSFDTAKVYHLPDYVTCDQIAWYDASNVIQHDGAVAQAGESYEIWVKLSTSVGGFAARSTLSKSATLNGKPAGITASDDSVWVRYRFPAAAKVIRSVELTVTEPVPGAAPTYMIYPADNTYDVWDAEDTVRWMVSSDGSNYTSMKPTDRFAVGKSYKLYVDIAAKNGYEFAVDSDLDPDITAAVNGTTARVGRAYEQSADEIVTVEYSIPVLTEPRTQIRSMSVTVPVPRAGEKPSYSAVIPYGEGYDLEAYHSDYWRSGVGWEDQNGLIRVDGDTVFKPGKTYTVTVSLVPSDASRYEFASSGLTATVNGAPAEIVVYEPKKVIFVMYSFTVAEGGYIIGDADTDGKITILDATAIQRKLANLPVQSYDEQAADADEDTKITILDATAIQRHLAAMSANPNIGKQK